MRISRKTFDERSLKIQTYILIQECPIFFGLIFLIYKEGIGPVDENRYETFRGEQQECEQNHKCNV